MVSTVSPNTVTKTRTSRGRDTSEASGASTRDTEPRRMSKALRQAIARRDMMIRTGAPAEGYITGAVAWEVLSLAFAEWANGLLVRYIDAAYPPENLPLEDAELLGEVA